MTETEHSRTKVPSTEDELYRAIAAFAADAGLSPSLVLKTLKADVMETAHPRRALTNFHRFLLTGFASTWLRDFQEHRVLQQILLELCSQSQFLADILVRSPELFRWLTSSNVLKLTKTSEHFAQEALEAIALFQRLEKKLDALKRFHRRELLRVGARQILREADVTVTSRELSSLADSIITAVLRTAYEQTSEGQPGRVEQEMAVIGVGKLGGGELNFSSDIDLMFVYEKDGPLNNPLGRMTTLHEYYSRVAEFVVRRLTEHTGEGHLYRVDMRLRPDGHSGPLAMSRAAYLAYYEARGEVWERQMLIKARVVAGDRGVGERWRESTQPFIYRKTLLVTPLEEILRIKTKIETGVESEVNIKLGSGGIRDIEFSAQALQLLNGGTAPELRESNTVLTLQKLTGSGLLKEKEGKGLEGAYKFLRTVEDRLQLLHGLQTHSLPESAEERRILSRQLGYKSVQAFARDVELHQRRIKAVFRSVFGLPVASRQRNGVPRSEYRLDTSHFRKAGFLDAAAGEKQLQRITRDMPELGMADRSRMVLEIVRKLGAADWCLTNFLLLASAGPMRRTLQQAMANEKTCELLLLLCSRSSNYARLLSREPLLFEELVGRPEGLLAPGLAWSYLRESDLQRYRMYNEFKIAVQYIVGEISIQQFTAALSQLAGTILADSFDRACAEVAGGAESQLALIGLGKLGGMEISIGSDLDVVLLHREGTKSGTAKAAHSVGRRLREQLEHVYEVDFRLRPEGKSAPLATEFEYYKRYLERRASLWERQSLIKARLLRGETGFGREVMEHIAHFTYHTPLPKSWNRDTMAMRQRIVGERSKDRRRTDLKVGVGGLMDLEFLTQAIQIRFGAQHPELIQPNTFEAVKALSNCGILMKAEVAKIVKNLAFLRRLETLVRMNAEARDFFLPAEKDRFQAIVAGMKFKSPRAFQSALLTLRHENRRMFNNVLRSVVR